MSIRERQLMSGPLSREAAFRLIVCGPIGVREISRLIEKLRLDREILAQDDELERELEREPLGVAK